MSWLFLHVEMKAWRDHSVIIELYYSDWRYIWRILAEFAEKRVCKGLSHEGFHWLRMVHNIITLGPCDVDEDVLCCACHLKSLKPFWNKRLTTVRQVLEPWFHSQPLLFPTSKLFRSSFQHCFEGPHFTKCHKMVTSFGEREREARDSYKDTMRNTISGVRVTSSPNLIQLWALSFYFSLVKIFHFS